MTITSVGYAGTITDSNWRRIAVSAVGSLYGVDDYTSFRVTAGPGDRALSVAAGGAFGLGVRDVSDAAVVVSGGAVSSGSRWDLVVLRRNWGTKTTTPVIIAGSAARALPARNTGYDAVNDQPLALVRFSAGQTVVQEIIDLRCIPGDGGLVAFDDLARSYLDRVGTTVRIGDIVWSRVINATGSPTWVSSEQGDTGWVNVPLGTGWESANGFPLQIRAVGALVDLRGAPYAKTTQAMGAFIATIPAAFRPTSALFIGGYHSGYGGGNYGELLITAAGVLQIPTGYTSAALGVNGVVPVRGMWLRG